MTSREGRVQVYRDIVSDRVPFPHTFSHAWFVRYRRGDAEAGGFFWRWEHAMEVAEYICREIAV